MTEAADAQQAYVAVARGEAHELRDATFPDGSRWSVGLVGASVADVVAASLRIAPRPLRRLRFERCSFRSVRFDGLRCEKTVFVHCTFHDSLFGEARIATLLDVRFESCEFVGLRLGHLVASRTSFEDCRLEDVQSGHSQWTRCAFRRTSIAGRLDNVAFVEPTFLAADFSRLRMRAGHLLGAGIDLGEVRLADDPEQFVMQPARLAEVAPAVASELGTEGARSFLDNARALAGLSGALVVEPGLFEDLRASERSLVMSRLYARRR